jgi:hypothetical protein
VDTSLGAQRPCFSASGTCVTGKIRSSSAHFSWRHPAMHTAPKRNHPRLLRCLTVGERGERNAPPVPSGFEASGLIKPTSIETCKHMRLASYEGQPAIVRFSPDSAVVVIWFCKYDSGHIVSGVPRAWDSQVRIPLPVSTPGPLPQTLSHSLREWAAPARPLGKRTADDGQIMKRSPTSCSTNSPLSAA